MAVYTYDASHPLNAREALDLEGARADLDNQHLNGKCAEEDDHKDRVVEKAFEHVPLVVDLACVDFVEQLSMRFVFFAS